MACPSGSGYPLYLYKGDFVTSIAFIKDAASIPHAGAYLQNHTYLI